MDRPLIFNDSNHITGIKTSFHTAGLMLSQNPLSVHKFINRPTANCSSKIIEHQASAGWFLTGQNIPFVSCMDTII